MKFLFSTIACTLFFVFQNCHSQVIIQTKLPDTVSHWKQKNTVGFDISQIAFMNWNAGGNTSISGLLKGNFIRKYETQNVKWLNELIVRYGVNKQDGIEVRKTDDAFQLNSTLGYRADTLSYWYHSAKFNFNTQFTNGFAYPNTDNAISKPFAPAYLFLGIGAEYINKEKKFTVYISPLTQKTTLVLDQTLANQGAFGVNKAILDAAGNVIVDGKNRELNWVYWSPVRTKKKCSKTLLWKIV